MKSCILWFLLGIVLGIVYPLLGRNAKLLGKRQPREYCPCGCGGEIFPIIKPFPESNRPQQATADFIRDIRNAMAKARQTQQPEPQIEITPVYERGKLIGHNIKHI